MGTRRVESYIAYGRLGEAARDVSWVNIWQDAAAAAFVAEHRDGNETVPTAFTGSGEMIPANAAAIKEILEVHRST